MKTITTHLHVKLESAEKITQLQHRITVILKQRRYKAHALYNVEPMDFTFNIEDQELFATVALTCSAPMHPPAVVEISVGQGFIKWLLFKAQLLLRFNGDSVEQMAALIVDADPEWWWMQ